MMQSETALDVVEWIDVPQQSEEWFKVRMGTLTASNFAAMGRGAESKTRTSLLRQMTAEIIGEIPIETFRNEAMDRGKRMEPAILAEYELRRGVEVTHIGHIRRTIRNPIGIDFVVGCSPDGLIGDRGLVQVKSMLPDKIVALVESGRIPAEHMPQCQGEMWVADREFNELVIGWEGFPLMPVFRIERDEIYIRGLRDSAEEFYFDLRKMVISVKKRGGLR